MFFAFCSNVKSYELQENNITRVASNEYWHHKGSKRTNKQHQHSYSKNQTLKDTSKKDQEKQ